MMKFYYEHEDYLNVPNGTRTYTDLDRFYGYQHPIFELNHTDEIIWNYCIEGYLDIYDYIMNNFTHFDKVFQTIREYPNVKLVFSSFHESQSYKISMLYRFLSNVKKRYGLSYNQLNVVTINLKENHYKRDVLSISKPYLLGTIADSFNLVMSGVNNYDANNIGLITTDSYLNTKKSKFFLNYNRNAMRYHRKMTLLWLLKNDMLKDTLYSAMMIDTDLKEYVFDFHNDEINDLADYAPEFIKMGVKLLDWDVESDEDETIFTQTCSNDMNHYNETVFSIISETSYQSMSLTLTEKCFKSFANCHPFIVMGDMGAHQKLKELGFELYDDLIDYTFDSIESIPHRLNATYKEIRRIYELGEDYIIEWYKNNIDKIERNKNKILTFSNEEFMNQTLEKIKNG